MGLFDRKFCDFCGEKIGLLGNKKLEDGNMCKNCAARLSPWFSERRHSTKAEIGAQLAYREENRKAVAAFRVTRSLGKYTKLLLDEDARRFAVTAARDLGEANPDILDYGQATGCDLDIEESRTEKKTTDKDGHPVSYNPPRYEYSYNFRVCIHVRHPYFDEIAYSLSNGYVHTGARMTAAVPAGWKLSQPLGRFQAANEYYEYLRLGTEIKAALDAMRREVRQEAAAQSAPKTAVVCPFCGATTVPDAQGCCEYCGSALGD